MTLFDSPRSEDIVRARRSHYVSAGLAELGLHCDSGFQYGRVSVGFRWVMKAKQRGATIIHVDSRFTRTSAVADLGTTAAQALLGRNYRLTQEHGNFVQHSPTLLVTSTLHPSAILRAPESEQRHAAYQQLVADLKK